MDERDKQQTDEQQRDGQLEEKAKEAREELDEVPPPGTDPLHEGP
jgi:hypothetical protein